MWPRTLEDLSCTKIPVGTGVQEARFNVSSTCLKADAGGYVSSLGTFMCQDPFRDCHKEALTVFRTRD